MPNHSPSASFMWSLFYTAFLLSSFALGRSTVAAAACASCENGGTCRPNSPNCACPIGWTGATCDQPYESCFNVDQTSKCLNGGKCLNGELDDFGNVQNYCACDSTHTGKYCQHTVLPMEEGCTVANQAKFCFNGGACNPGYYPDSQTSKPCLCPPGFTGDRCEDVAEAGNSVAIHAPATSTAEQQQLLMPSDREFGQWGSNTDAADTCNLPCQRGKCAFGELIAHPDGWDAPSDTMHCACEDGYGGPYCEYEAEECGGHMCYNGATCVVDEATDLLHCDCTTADRNDGVYFAGQFCQYGSDDYCAYHPQVGHLFCVNHGKCNANDPFEGCDCPAGYEGFSCEFKSGSSDLINGKAVYGECNLQCQNGGECRMGGQYLSAVDPNDSVVVASHCVCPAEFGGDLCELPAANAAQTLTGSGNYGGIDCGIDRHTCDNSAKCVAWGDELLCDCGAGTLATFYEGENCSHPSHDICTKGVAASDQAAFHQVVPTTQLSYCVNGGRCKSAVEEGAPHPGCNCVDGFLGPHCELKESSPIPRVTYGADASDDDYGEKKNRNVFRVGIAVVMFLVMTVFAVMLIHTARRRRKQRFNNETTTSMFWSSGYTDLPNENVNNIAPKRSSSIFMESPRDVYTDAVQTSRRDMAIEMSNRTRKSSNLSSDEDTKSNHGDDRPDDVPKLYIGPPRDEDGHELHNVEIV